MFMLTLEVVSWENVEISASVFNLFIDMVIIKA